MLCRGVLLVTGIALMGVLTANVIARYVLATGGFDWAEEVPEQVFPWFIMAGVALAVQHGGHIAVEWLLGEFRANSAVAVNEVDQAPFRAATAPVADKWEARPFGDFVKRLRAAAAV